MGAAPALERRRSASNLKAGAPAQQNKRKREPDRAPARRQKKRRAPDLNLLEAASNGDKDRCLVELNSGADVNQTRPNDGATPLHVASFNGHEDICELLLDRGANINQTDGLGRTPLRIASDMGREEVCMLLLKRGAESTREEKEKHFFRRAAMQLVGEESCTSEAVNECSKTNEIGQVDGTCWFAAVVQLIAHVPQIMNKLNKSIQFSWSDTETDMIKWVFVTRDTRSTTHTRTASVSEYIRTLKLISDGTCARIPDAFRTKAEELVEQYGAIWESLKDIDHMGGNRMARMNQPFHNFKDWKVDLLLHSVLECGGVRCVPPVIVSFSEKIYTRCTQSKFLDRTAGDYGTIAFGGDPLEHLPIDVAMAYIKDLAIKCGAIGGIFVTVHKGHNEAHACAFTMCEGRMCIRNTNLFVLGWASVGTNSMQRILQNFNMVRRVSFLTPRYNTTSLSSLLEKLDHPQNVLKTHFTKMVQDKNIFGMKRIMRQVCPVVAAVLTDEDSSDDDE